MRVGIVGAGIAGLACARRLATEGADVRVFDKARGPGGRLATRRGSDWQADIGAQYFTARDPVFRDAVAEWAEAGVVARWDAAPVCLEHGAVEVSDDGRERWVGVPRMSALTRHLAEGVDTTHERPIAAIEAAQTGWQLRDERGHTAAPFDAVAVALPAPQAAGLLAQPAPALAEEAAAVPMQGCWAGVLELGAAVLAFEAAFVFDSPLRWIARDAGKPGRDGSAVWVAHSGPVWSDPRMEWTREAALPELTRLFADATHLDVAAVHALDAHKWRYSQSPQPHAAGCLLDAGAGIGACGDWCNGNRVEGAWESGHTLAERLLDQRDPSAA